MSVASGDESDSYNSPVFGSPTQSDTTKMDPLNMNTKRILVLLGQIKSLTGEALRIKKETKQAIIANAEEIEALITGGFQAPSPTCPASQIDPPLTADEIRTVIREELATSAAPDVIRAVVRETVREETRTFTANIKSHTPTPTPSPQPTSPSFASVAATPATPRPPTRHALVVETTDSDSNSREGLAGLWRKTISFKTTYYAPARVVPIRSNRLRVEFDTKAQRDETLQRVNNTSNLKATPLGKLSPMVMLKGISKDTPSTELATIITTQNPSVGEVALTDKDITLKFIRENRKTSALYNAALMVSPAVWRELTKLGRVNIDHQRVHVAEHVPVLQCRKCLQFGHLSSKCQSESIVCSHCAAYGHKYLDCPDRKLTEKTKCFNCASSGKPSDHLAISNKCPLHHIMCERVRHMTDYGN
ncbi:hypothetical protein ABMA28_004258 [Loxostege sticticalis]|uniref:CCHC-type domain-containing protein n=1 Tax=Loxostege sticticalis TaxID=481309 RepID=A0ABD0SQK8_LOXSC